MTDRPNQLDDLWTDWETKTLDQKQALLKKAVGMSSKVLFSNHDIDHLHAKALEVGKALNINSGDRMLMTPSREWLEKNNPNYAKASSRSSQGRSLHNRRVG